MGSVKGIAKTISELRKFGKDAEKMIDAETEAIAVQIETDAKTLAPKNFGKLAQSISHDKPEALQRRVTVNEKYAPYVEFGTGKLVSVPAEWEQMAKSFKGKSSGSFQDFIEAMTIWFKAKGYDTKNVWIACINKLNNGSEARPFLYPAYVKGKKDYQNNLNKLLKNFKRKI